MKFALEQNGVGAEINVALLFDQPFDNFLNLRMNERLSSRNGNHRRPAFFGRLQTFFDRKIFGQNIFRVLNFAAPFAFEITAKKRLEHQHQRVAFNPFDLLLHDVAKNF